MAKKPDQTPDEVPVLRTVVLGRTKAGLFAAAILTSQGAKVLGRELLAIGEEDGIAADAWREESYRRVFLKGEEPEASLKLATARALAPHKGEHVLEGAGYGLHRTERHWTLYRIEFEESAVTDREIIDTGEWLYLWERLECLAARNLLPRDTRRTSRVG